jgi:hypothetical protein
MPLKTDFNVAPYNDDYDETKNFHRMLFRPATAVQARELTQLQTILQNQIERFGNYVFKSGDIVTGCSITDVNSLPYVRLHDYQTNGYGLDVTTLTDALVVDPQSNLQARVLVSTAGVATNYPNTKTIYVSYINTGANGEMTFANSANLSFYHLPNTGANATAFATVNTFSNSVANTFKIGNAHAISVDAGIIYINGHFVRVLNPTIGLVNPYDQYAGNSVVGFALTETIITENQDDSLFDNALGYSNENAPGAHRLKLVPELVTYDANVAASIDKFHPIATYNYGALITTSTSTSNIHSVINEAIAQRTYEESGNYVVNPFVIDTVTSLPGNSVVSALDSNSVLGRIGPGIGYSQGNRVELQKTSYINMRRGIDTDVKEAQQITFNYGGFLQLNETAGSFDFAKAQQVTLYDTYQRAVTNRQFTSLSPSGNAIGTAMARCFTHTSGIPGTNTAVYILHIFNVAISNGYNVSQIASVYYSNGSVKGVGDVYNNGGVISSALKDQLYSFGVSGIKNLRDSSNNNNTQYTYRAKTSTTMATNGAIVVTLPASAPGGVDILPYGSGIQSDGEASSFIVAPTANVDTSALTGTVTINTDNNSVIGSSTTFNADFFPGALIKVGSTVRSVSVVTNNTFMTVDAPFAANAAGQTYYKSYLAGKILPLNSILNGSYVNVTNSTSFTINTSQAPASGLNVDVTYDVLRTSASPAAKVINKHRFVKIDTTSKPNGPWCLGFADVHRINAVYGAATNTYTTAGTDVMNYVVFDSGQTDTHYGLGYLYPRSGYNVSGTPYLLVDLDYFSANTSPGVGFFTVESYPIDDVDTSNTNAIQTKDIPLYIDESGAKIPLRDRVDFRPYATNTANNTGVVDTANATQVTTAISYATFNPSTNVAFSTPAGGLNVPSYGKNFQADFTTYLPRKDLIYLAPSGSIKVKEGLSKLAPQTPLYPESAMVIGVVNMQPFPSLSTDQVDELAAVNRTSIRLCRDTGSKVSITLVPNKRYTMNDIGKLDQRITNLEYYTQLTMLEKQAKDMTVTDINGLDRFKNGIFVDPFSSFSLSDISNPEFSIAIDSKKGVARPKIIREVINLKFNQSASTNVQLTGRILTLPYTSIEYIVQPFATKYRSAAHVAYAWNGTLQLMPSYTNHMDVHQTGSMSLTFDSSRPWEEFASSPMSYSWGDWRTTTETASSTVVTGSVETYNLSIWFGFQANDGSWISNLTKDQLYTIMVANGINPGQDWVVGNITLTSQGTVAWPWGLNPNPPAGALDASRISFEPTSQGEMMGGALGWF